jgi:membrane protease YdiL (CAAX protease family)
MKQLKFLTIPIILLILYTFIYSLEIQGIFGVFLEMAPGIIGVLYLRTNGFTQKDVYMKFTQPSHKSVITLLLFGLVIIPILATSHRDNFDFQSFFIIAPLSAIGQELFFRSTLLSSLTKILKNDKSALIIHSILFSLWHLPLAIKYAPLGGIFGVFFVTFIGGIVWGWVAKRDKTILWVLIQHSLYLMVMSLFTWL